MKHNRVQVAPGQWVDVPRPWMVMACCDCGLVHLVRFRLRRRGFNAYGNDPVSIQMQAWRAEKATKQERRRMMSEQKCPKCGGPTEPKLDRGLAEWVLKCKNCGREILRKTKAEREADA